MVNIQLGVTVMGMIKIIKTIKEVDMMYFLLFSILLEFNKTNTTINQLMNESKTMEIGKS